MCFPCHHFDSSKTSERMSAGLMGSRSPVLRSPDWAEPTPPMRISATYFPARLSDTILVTRSDPRTLTSTSLMSGKFFLELLEHKLLPGKSIKNNSPFLFGRAENLLPFLTPVGCSYDRKCKDER